MEGERDVGIEGKRGKRTTMWEFISINKKNMHEVEVGATVSFISILNQPLTAFESVVAREDETMLIQWLGVPDEI